MTVNRSGRLLGPLFVLSLLAWGCASEAEDATLEGDAAVPPRESGAEGAPDAGAAAGDYLVRMVGLQEAEASGTAAFRPAQGGTEVTVALEGVQPGGIYQGHVHEGDTCDQIGRMRWPLQPATAAAETGSQSLTALPVPMDSVMNGNTVVVFHEQDGQPMVCGDIPVLPPNLPA